MSITTDNEYTTTCSVQDVFYFIGANGLRTSTIYGYRMAGHSWVQGPGFSDIEKFEIKRIR